MERMLSSEEAARRLGVKVSTLYAYVSRGLLASHLAPDGRRSLFDLSEVEQLGTRQRGSRRVESRLATVTTAVTQLRSDGPFYRGRSAIECAATLQFEQVAALLWDEEVPASSGAAPSPWQSPPLGACPLRTTDERMRWTLVMCGAADPLRSDLRPVAVTRAARAVAAALVDAVPAGEASADPTGSIAVRLAARLSAAAEDRSLGDDRTGAVPAAAVDAALVLMADHELATSTMAVRLAASTRADLYDALSAGLATLAGPLHGTASQRAYALLAAAERDGVAPALNDALQQHGRLPGFGHSIYRERDPRFDPLWDLASPLLSAPRRALVGEVMELAAGRDVPPPNCDLALAALSWGTGMPSDAGRTIFTVARIAGWTAHYIEELAERPLRFRARAVYSTT